MSMEMVPPGYRRCPCDRGVLIPPDLPRCYRCEEDRAEERRTEKGLQSARLTLAAAALQGRIVADQIRLLAGATIGPARSCDLAAMAAEDADATLAALRKEGE